MKNRNIGIIISYVNMVVATACGLFLGSFLIRTLGDVEYGLYQTIASFANYLVLLEFGTGTVMARNIAVARNTSGMESVEKNYSTVFTISLVLSAMILVVSAIFYLNVGSIYSKTMTPDQVVYAKKIFIFLTLYIIFIFLGQSCDGFMLGMEQYILPKVIALAKTVMRFVLLVTLISFRRYAILIAVVDCALGFVIFAGCFIYCTVRFKVRPSVKMFDKSVFRQSLPLCLALFLQTIINQANNNVDKFVIGIKMSLESVALYSVAQYIITMFSSILTTPVSMYMPEVSKNMAKGLRGKELTETLIPPCRFAALIGGTILCGFFAVGRQFISIVYEKSRVEAWLYAMIVLVPMFINMTNAVIINVLDVANKRLVRSLLLLGTTVLNIVLTVILIQSMGIVGAVVATAISMLIGHIFIMNLYYYKVMKINVIFLFYRAYKGILIYQIAAGVITFFAARMISNIYVSFFAGGFMFVALSFFSIFMLGFDKSERRAYIAKFRRKR